jgi:methanesulfonate monooxygenase small subunit
VRSRVQELVYRSFLFLDDRDFEGFLTLCHDDFRYTIRAEAPEIRRDMVWLDHDKPGLATLFRNLHRHHSDPSRLTRHATVYVVDFADASEQRAAVVTGLQVFLTEIDGGETRLYAVGKVRDSVRVVDGKPLLESREIRLDTRQLGIGTHIPF